jgi:HEAT repeat protein
VANRKIEDQVEALGRLRETGPGAETAAAVRKALRDRSGLVVAKAAKVAAELQLREVIPELVESYARLFERVAERDPQCWGKTAIARALAEMDYRESAPYLRGARHVQMEPVWGGQADTASNLRGTCLLSLIACSDIRREAILRCLVDALVEPAQTVRVEAVRALVEMGGDDSALLLRLKARAGDEEAAVVGQAFDGVLRLEGASAIAFIAEFLRASSEYVQAEAALALGASRLPEAVEALIVAWGGARDPMLRDAIARAISASRQERGFAFLLELVRNGRPVDSSSALEALAIHRESPEIWKRVEEARNWKATNG